MTIDQIKTEAEDFIDDTKSVILPLQQAWLDTHSTYWQGLRTPTVTPQNGAELPTDGSLARYPMLSWEAFGITLPTTSPFSIGCDEVVDWQCEMKIFSLWCRFIFSDVTYCKRSNWCEESGWVDHEWEMQEPLDQEPPE